MEATIVYWGNIGMEREWKLLEWGYRMQLLWLYGEVSGLRVVTTNMLYLKTQLCYSLLWCCSPGTSSGALWLMYASRH